MSTWIQWGMIMVGEGRIDEVGVYGTVLSRKPSYREVALQMQVQVVGKMVLQFGYLRICPPGPMPSKCTISNVQQRVNATSHIPPNT